jgi:hypothetical protein
MINNYNVGQHDFNISYDTINPDINVKNRASSWLLRLSSLFSWRHIWLVTYLSRYLLTVFGTSSKTIYKSFNAVVAVVILHICMIFT